MYKRIADIGLIVIAKYLLVIHLCSAIDGENVHEDMFLQVSDYERHADKYLPKPYRDFLQRGALDDSTLLGNRAEFLKIKVLPRFLRGVSNRHTDVTILGVNYTLPVGISATGRQKRWHPKGEAEMAMAAAEAGTLMVLSTMSAVTIEDVAAAAPHGHRWFQNHIFNNLTLTRLLNDRVYKAGYTAIVFTIDQPVRPLRYYNKRNHFVDDLPIVNMEPYINLEPGVVYTNEQKIEMCDKLLWEHDKATWEDLRTIINESKLPIILKGVLSGEDAKLAKAYGARGIIVSNHGGRQLDGSMATIEALRRIGEQYPELLGQDNFDIYLDSGIRSGLDVFKALALGAKFVFAGRAPLYGLIHSGQRGVQDVLKILQKELTTVMAQAGCDNISCINSSLVVYS